MSLEFVSNLLNCTSLFLLGIYVFPFILNAVLLWLLTAACIKTGRPQIARRAIDLAESRLLKDSWPEYYDGKLGRYVGKQARKYQTWSIAGYLVAKMLLEDPSHLGMISLEEDRQMKPLIKRSSSWTCWRAQQDATDWANGKEEHPRRERSCNFIRSARFFWGFCGCRFIESLVSCTIGSAETGVLLLI